MNANKLIISLESDDELREKMAAITPGQKVIFEVEATLDDQNETKATLSVTSAELIDSGSIEAEDEEEGGGGEMEDMMEEMPMGKKKGPSSVNIVELEG